MLLPFDYDSRAACFYVNLVTSSLQEESLSGSSQAGWDRLVSDIAAIQKGLAELRCGVPRDEQASPCTILFSVHLLIGFLLGTCLQSDRRDKVPIRY